MTPYCGPCNIVIFSSIGSFHLMHLMFDDYILYHLEQMCCTEISDEILSDIKGTPKVSSIGRDILLPSNKIINIELGSHSSPKSAREVDESNKETHSKSQGRRCRICDT